MKCVFSTPFIREQVDPRVKKLWSDRYGKGAPFGNLRLMWKERHCATLNPYGSENCPYRPEDCALAFLAAVERVTAPDVTNPTGMFRTISTLMAAERADNKPLARDRIVNVGSKEGPSNTRTPAGDIPAGPGVRSRTAVPQRISELLGSLDLGARKGPTPNGEEGKK